MQSVSNKNILRFVISLLLVSSFSCLAESAKPARQEKGLVGHIEDDRYVARDKSFSFSLPIEGSLREVKEAINDSLSPGGTHVITINSASESSNYRFEISIVRPGDKNNSNFSQATSKTFDWYRRLIQRAWQKPLTEIVNEEFDWNGRRAAHAIYKQFAETNTGPRYHVFYLADFGDHVSFLWTNISLAEENLELEDTIIAASSGPALKAKLSFLSFRIE